jgi:hypothetical protein
MPPLGVDARTISTSTATKRRACEECRQQKVSEPALARRARKGLTHRSYDATPTLTIRSRARDVGPQRSTASLPQISRGAKLDRMLLPAAHDSLFARTKGASGRLRCSVRLTGCNKVNVVVQNS